MRHIATGLAIIIWNLSAGAQTLTTASQPGTQSCHINRGDTCFAFFADGNVRKAIDKKDGGTPASGSIGFSIAKGRTLFTGQINIADKPDTVRSAFGASFVTPGVGGALSAGLLDVRILPRNNALQGLGWHGYASISSSRWATAIDESGAITATTDPAILGLGALGTWVVANGQVSENPVFIAIDAGPTFRQIFGDIANHENDELKKRLYDTSRETFFGVEVGLNLQINAIKAGLTYYFFDGDARGLTDGQVVAGFSIQSNVFSGKLSR